MSKCSQVAMLVVTLCEQLLRIMIVIKNDSLQVTITVFVSHIFGNISRQFDAIFLRGISLRSELPFCNIQPTTYNQILNSVHRNQ